MNEILDRIPSESGHLKDITALLAMRYEFDAVAVRTRRKRTAEHDVGVLRLKYRVEHRADTVVPKGAKMRSGNERVHIGLEPLVDGH